MLAENKRLRATPTTAELQALAIAAESGTGEARNQLALALLATDSVRDEQLKVAACALLAGMHPRAWLALDVAARKSRYMAPAWSASVRKRLGGRDPSMLTLVLASFHHDGHIREAAVARMGELDNANSTMALALALALRSSDWVDQVRGRARASLEARLKDNGAALVAIAPLALAMRERELGAWLADRVEHELRIAVDAILRAAMNAPDWRTRRLAHDAAIGQSRLGFEELLTIAIHESDLPTRVRATEAAVAMARSNNMVAELRPLLESHTSYVRSEAVNALAKAGDLEPAITALADFSPMVRRVAQSAVRRAGVDPAERYRALATSDAPVPGAVAGLGETGSSSDIPLLTKWLHHPSAKGRTAALRGLRMLGGASAANTADLLEDRSPAVTREAAKALRRHAKELDGGLLQRLVAPDRPRHTRVAAFLLLQARDPWTRLATDLQFVGDPERAVAHRARTDLDSWLRREAATAYARPAGSDAERLRLLMDHAESSLPPDDVKALRFHLGLQRADAKSDAT